MFENLESFYNFPKEELFLGIRGIRILNHNWEFHIRQDGPLFEGRLVFRKYDREEKVFFLSKNRAYTCKLLIDCYGDDEFIDIFYDENIYDLVDSMLNTSKELEVFHKLN